MNKELKVAFTGGGSGGHTMPAISLIDGLKDFSKENNIDLSILYIGSDKGVEREIAEKNNIIYKSISTGKLRRYFSIKNFTDIFRIIKGFFDSLYIIKKFKPHLLFSTGGFVSVPPVIASKLLGIKVIIHEQTIDAGLANKIASKFSDKICLTFKESLQYFPQNKAIVTGIPLREKIFLGTLESARKRFEFDPHLPVLFFTGGGLGCHILNETAIKIIPELLDKTNIVFQTGASNEGNDYLNMRRLYDNLSEDKKKRFVVYNFINDEIADIFKITTLAIARSGAGTVCELLSLKIPAIFIPLAIATKNEQYKNARIMADIGAADIIEEKNLNPTTLFDKIQEIVFTNRIVEMKNNLNSLNDINGKREIIDLIMKTIR